MKLLLDTNVLSVLIVEKEPPPGMLERFLALKDEAATASIVLHEIRFGADRLPARSKRRRMIVDFFESRAIPILPYDERAAVWHAQERARLERRGLARPFADGQIAAIAAVNGLTLVTRNPRHFAPFHGLAVESW